MFESAEARDLLTVLGAAADPTNAKLVRAALATSLVGLSANRLCEVSARNEEWDRQAARFLEWNADWIRHGFMRMMRRILDDEQPGDGKIATAVLGLPQGERRLTNVLHLAELLHESALSGHRGPYELIEWLRREIDDALVAGELAPEKAQIRLESDANAVVLTTIHKAKGLEWPIVYCPYLWVKSGLFGDDTKHVRYHDDDGRIALDLGSAELSAHRQLASDEARAENLRLLYVALTRARHQCSLVWGGFKTAKESSLGHFLAPPRWTSAGTQACSASSKAWRMNPVGRLRFPSFRSTSRSTGRNLGQRTISKLLASSATRSTAPGVRRASHRSPPVTGA